MAQMPSFVDNVEAFAAALGPVHAPVVLDLAQVPWLTSVQRDEFVEALTGFGA